MPNFCRALSSKGLEGSGPVCGAEATAGSVSTRIDRTLAADLASP